MRHGDLCVGVYYAPSVNSDVCVDVRTRPARVSSEAQAEQIAEQLNLGNIINVFQGRQSVTSYCRMTTEFEVGSGFHKS